MTGRALDPGVQSKIKAKVEKSIPDPNERRARTVSSEMVLSCWHVGRRSMTDIVRREAEFPFCLFTGNDQRGFILQPEDAT